MKKIKWYINNQEFNSWKEAIEYIDDHNSKTLSKLHYEDIKEINHD